MNRESKWRLRAKRLIDQKAKERKEQMRNQSMTSIAASFARRMNIFTALKKLLKIRI